MSTSAFDLLHRKIQEELYAMKWTELRKIQVESIKEIINSEKHLIISAQTASGKTEAAFLPILSIISDLPEPGIKAIYVSPLKALINDQFRRLEILCKRINMPVFKWHGDVGQKLKKKALTSPAGVLLITPESIESLLINHPQALSKLFSTLRFCVIDELHHFIDSERGVQLKSQIKRLENYVKKKFRLVGLSATIGDMNLAADWMSFGKKETVKLIIDENEKKTIKFRLHGYLQKKDEESSNQNENDDNPIAPSTFRLIDDVYYAFRNQTGLVFSNNKGKLEYYADLVKRKSKILKQKDIFYVHHGSLSKIEREDSEDELRSTRNAVVFCSSTLELGIDVGNIQIVGQIGSPWSINSLIQRLGRSGRYEGQPSVMRMYIEEKEIIDDTSLTEKLYPHMLQSIAIVELMFEKWCEPPDITKYHLSTLVHQILSVITEFGGKQIDSLYSLLIKNEGAFNNISKDTFVDVLRSMKEKDLIEQTEENDLILGLTGENIVRSYKFYAVFNTKDEMRVLWDHRLIGTIEIIPGFQCDTFLILAGRRWKIIDINEKAKEIMVKPSKGGRLPSFSGGNGPEVHEKIRIKMQELMFNKKEIIYLDDTSRDILNRIRKYAITLFINNEHFITHGQSVVWFTWTSSKIHRTLIALAQHYLKLNVEDEDIAIVFKKSSIEDVKKGYKGLLNNWPTELELALKYKMLSFEKYDDFLYDELKSKSFGNNYLDLNSTKRIIGGL